MCIHVKYFLNNLASNKLFIEQQKGYNLHQVKLRLSVQKPNATTYCF
mgnify:CR=1 FL=1